MSNRILTAYQLAKSLRGTRLQLRSSVVAYNIHPWINFTVIVEDKSKLCQLESCGTVSTGTGIHLNLCITTRGYHSACRILELYQTTAIRWCIIEVCISWSIDKRCISNTSIIIISYLNLNIIIARDILQVLVSSII